MNFVEKRKKPDNKNKDDSKKNLAEVSIYIFNINQILIYLNQKVADTLGGKKEDFIGKSLSEVFPDRYELLKKKHDQVFSTGEEMVFEEIEDLPLGRRWIWTNIFPLRDKNSNITGIQTVTQDVLWRRRAEKELKRYHKKLEELVDKRTAELTRLNKDLNKEIIKLKSAEEKNWLQQEQLIQADKMVSLGVLVSGVAHEINNPNGFIMLNIPILQKIWKSILPILDKYYKKNGDFTVANQDYSKIKNAVSPLFSSMLDASRRIGNIINGLKNYSRKDPSDLNQNVNIKDVVNNAIILVSNLIKKSTNNFSTDLSDNIPIVRGNPQRLEQVIINLIENACQSLKNKNSGIIVSTKYSKEEDEITIEIQDEGVGIERKNIKKVTDPFYTTKRSLGGTGLGLSISSKIVRSHKGMLTFDSEKGKGTKVSLILPVGNKL